MLDFAVIEKVSLFIVSLCAGIIDNQDKIGEYKVTNIMLLCLQNNITNSDMVGIICCSLLCLCNKCNSNQSIVGDVTNSKLLIEALGYQIAIPKIYKLVCMTMLTTCTNRNDLKLNFCDVTLAALLSKILEGKLNVKIDPDVTNSSILLIRHLCTQPESRKVFIDVGMHTTMSRVVSEATDKGIKKLAKVALQLLIAEGSNK
jgi:hypothetical protein